LYVEDKRVDYYKEINSAATLKAAHRA